MQAIVKKVWNAVSSVLVALVVLLALLLAGVRFVGLQVYTVLSGSMEPEYPVGSLIYVKETDPFTLQSGDVITFMINEDTLATHRIVAVVPDADDPGTIRFRTKGDANEMEDGSLVHYKNVVGKPIFKIPGLGYVASYIQRPPGLYITIAAAVVILLLAFLPDMLGDEKAPEEKPRREKKKKPAPAPIEAEPPAPPPPKAESPPPAEEEASFDLDDILRELQ